jgi:hypothetical protein
MIFFSSVSKFKFACKQGDQSGLGRIFPSIAIQCLLVFTQPRPISDLIADLSEGKRKEPRMMPGLEFGGRQVNIS